MALASLIEDAIERADLLDTPYWLVIYTSDFCATPVDVHPPVSANEPHRLIRIDEKRDEPHAHGAEVFFNPDFISRVEIRFG